MTALAQRLASIAPAAQEVAATMLPISAKQQAACAWLLALMSGGERDEFLARVRELHGDVAAAAVKRDALQIFDAERAARARAFDLSQASGFAPKKQVATRASGDFPIQHTNQRRGSRR